MNNGTEAFEQLRPRLLGIAYRMLGTVQDAEDVVQDVYLRWHQAEQSSVREPAGWLVSATTRRAIDRLPRDLDLAAATGLAHLGAVREWEPAHTAENYVQKEMGYQVARRHAARLRSLALLGLGLSLLFVIASALLQGLPAAFCALLAAFLFIAASLVQRWLFFAQAQHIVTLYYGAESA